MSSHLKTLADTSLDTEAVEAAVAEGAWQTATDALDRAELALEDLRSAWPDLNPAERAVVGPSAAELKRRLADARKRIPKLTALSVGTVERDPDEEQEPQH